MEIHAPHHAILTFKEALVHLCIVTVGIVIALSLDGALEWSHHQTLVREARLNLQNEIRNNQKDIQIILKSLEGTKGRFLHAVDVLNGLSTPDNLKQAASIFDLRGGPGTLLAGYTIATLNSASRTTAEVSGAFEFMEYDEIRKYAEIYEPQEIFGRAQDEAMKDAIVASTLGQSIAASPAPAEVEDVKRQLRLALGGFIETEIMAKALDAKYGEALKDGR